MCIQEAVTAALQRQWPVLVAQTLRSDEAPHGLLYICRRRAGRRRLADLHMQRNALVYIVLVDRPHAS
jgi:hypothetical protein